MKASTSARAADLGEVERDSAIPMIRRKSDPRELAPESSPMSWPESGPMSRPSGELAGVPRPTNARRFVIRLFGFAAVGACIWGVAYIAREPRARAEIATWGTLGNPKLAGTAARGVRSVVDTVRSMGK